MKLLFLLAFKNLISNKSRTILSILGVTLGIATVVCIVNLDINTIIMKRRQYFGGYARPDLEIYLPYSAIGNEDQVISDLSECGELHSVSPVILDYLIWGKQEEIPAQWPSRRDHTILDYLRDSPFITHLRERFWRNWDSLYENLYARKRSLENKKMVIKLR